MKSRMANSNEMALALALFFNYRDPLNPQAIMQDQNAAASPPIYVDLFPFFPWKASHILASPP